MLRNEIDKGKRVIHRRQIEHDRLGCGSPVSALTLTFLLFLLPFAVCVNSQFSPGSMFRVTTLVAADLPSSLTVRNGHRFRLREEGRRRLGYRHRSHRLGRPDPGD